MQDPNTKLNSNASSPTSTSIQVTSTDIANSTCRNSDPSTFITTSDCDSLGSPYTPPGRSLILGKDIESFDLHCGTDLSRNNTEFMGFMAFTFEDCIAACANFNQQAPTLHGNLTCYGASFVHGLEDNGRPSCYLKGAQDIAPSSNAEVDSATLI